MFNHYIFSLIASVKKNRFFYFLNIIGFLIGSLLLTIILTFTFQELSFDKFHANGENVYRLHPEGYGVTPPCFKEKINNQFPAIKSIIRLSSDNNLVVINSQKEQIVGKVYYTDPEIFKIFSFDFLLGIDSTALVELNSVVISRSTASKLFGDNSPLGEVIITKDSLVLTITGVFGDIPYNSHIKSNAFISIESLRNAKDDKTFNCGEWSMLTYVLLSDDSSIDRVEAEVNAFLEDFRMEGNNGKIPLVLQPLHEIYFDDENNKFDGSVHGNRQTVILYFAISILILFIVVINYINLSLAISGKKVKEIAIKKVLGASRFQIVMQILLEAIVLSLISMVFSIVLIELLLPDLCYLLNIHIAEIPNNFKVYFLYIIGISIVGLISGVFPGIFLSRVDALKVLKNESVFKSRGVSRKVLLTFQLFIVAFLLNSTFIVNSQIDYLLSKDLGFNYQNVITLKLNKSLQENKDLLKQNLLQNPDIYLVSFSNSLLGEGLGKTSIGYEYNTELCNILSVDPDYFNLYEIDVKLGRNFSSELQTDISNSCIINEETCRLFEIDSPINKKFSSRTIVGVVNNFNFSSLHNKIEPLYILLGDEVSVAQIKISQDNQEKSLQYIRAVCNEISDDNDFNLTFLETSIEELYKSEIELKNSFRFYSFITFLIALLGLFGLTLFTINKKTKEICIRKLFGASLRGTAKLLAKDQIWVVVVSNILSVPITIWQINRWLDNFSSKNEIDPFVFLKTFIITLIFTFLVILVLLLKINKMKIIENLRDE